MKCLAVLLCVVAAASAVSFYDLIKEEWEAYKLQHKKHYPSEVEDKFRMKIYAENKHKIAKHNQRYQRGLEPFSLEQNKYGDMLHHEFVHTMNGFNKTLKHEQNRRSHVEEPTRRLLFWLLKKKHQLVKHMVDSFLDITTTTPRTKTPAKTTKARTRTTKPAPLPKTTKANITSSSTMSPINTTPSDIDDHSLEYNGKYIYPNRYYYDYDYDPYYQDSLENLKKRKRQRNMHNIKKQKNQQYKKQPRLLYKNKDGPKGKQTLSGVIKEKVKQQKVSKKVSGQELAGHRGYKAPFCVFLQGVCFPVNAKKKQARP